MIVIGFGYKSQNGKDTAGEAIVNYYASQAATAKKHGVKYAGPRVTLMKFAGALYKEVNDALKAGIWDNREVAETRPLNTTGKTQIYGSVHGKVIVPINATAEFHTILPSWVQPDPNPIVSPLAPYGKHPKLLQWWGTDYRRAQDKDYWVKRALASIPQGTDIALFTDVRFLNEAQAIKDAGGHLVEVTRLNLDGTRYIATDRPADHPSEAELIGYNWDHYIVSKNAVLTGEMAVTITEYICGLETK